MAITASLAFEPNSERREQAMAWLPDNLENGKATQKAVDEVKNPDSGEVIVEAAPSGLELFLTSLRMSWGANDSMRLFAEFDLFLSLTRNEGPMLQFVNSWEHQHHKVAAWV